MMKVPPFVMLMCLILLRFASSSHLVNPSFSHQSLRLRGGSSAAAQMAEIRARRAKEYEAARAKEVGNSQSNAADGVQNAWVYISGRVGPSTISCHSKKMAQGDARNFYLDSEVTVFRNRKTGAVLEILHDSTGWFQFCAAEGARVQQLSSTGNVYDSNRWYVPGLIEELKQSPIKASIVRSEGLQLGAWKAAADGGEIVLTNGRSRVHLTEAGFSNDNFSSQEVVHIVQTGKIERVQLVERQGIKTA